MRIPTHHLRDDDRSSAAMTPMIDVVFLLLIFFVCASIGQVRELVLATDLAGGGVEAAVEPPPEEPPRQQYWLYLRRRDDRTVFEINNAHFDDYESLAKVLSGLAKWAKEDPLILDIAPDVPAGDMIRVYDTCRQAGFESINFAADPNAEGSPERNENR